MLTLDLSSYLLEVSNDAYTTLSQFWLTVQADLLISENNERQLWTLTAPINIACVQFLHSKSTNDSFSWLLNNKYAMEYTIIES